MIEKFIDKQLPKIEDADRIPDEFEAYWENEKMLALKELCEAENLDQAQFKSLIDAYIYSDQEATKG